MKKRLCVQCSMVLFLFGLMIVPFCGCTDTTGSAGAVAVFDEKTRCRYCNEKITNDDIDNLKQHGNGICAPEIDFVDSSTHLCNHCGKPYVYNAQSSHGINVCVYSCAGKTGHRVPSAGEHSSCKICGDWLCISSHGEGICGTLETGVTSPTDSVTMSDSETTTMLSYEAATTPSVESGTSGETKSSDYTLRNFTAVFPDGTKIDMRTVEARQNIVVTEQDSVEIKAIASDDKATVSGDQGILKLSLGKNSFRVIVTAENETKAYFFFTIVVKEPASAPVSKPSQEPTPPAPTTVKNVCTKCRNNVDTITEHLRVCGHYSCDTDLSMELEHELGECGVSGHYWCDENDHSPVECGIAGHYCGDGMRHFTCSKCNGVFCDDKHRNYYECPDWLQ